MNTIQKVVLFSGGRTSGRMLRWLLDIYPGLTREWKIIFCNTGKEMPQTLDFVHAVETHWNVPIVWLEYTRVPAAEIPQGIFPTPRRNANLARAAERGEHAHWFRQVNHETASRTGRPFNELLEWASVCPNVRARICSVQLKIRTAMRYLFAQGVQEYEPYIGIRKDEEHRKLEILRSCDAYEHPQFPLVDWGVTEKDVLDFWSASPFDLQLESYQGNCDLCFLKKKAKRIRIAKEQPELVAWWKDWEARKALTTTSDGRYFRRGEPYAEIERLAKLEVIEDNPNDQDIACSCAEKGFGSDDEP